MKPSRAAIVRAAGAVWTAHARQVVQARGFRVEDVDAALAAPEVTRQDGPCRLFSRGHITVVTDDSGPEIVVVTVLLRDYAEWDNAKARAANA